MADFERGLKCVAGSRNVVYTNEIDNYSSGVTPVVSPALAESSHSGVPLWRWWVSLLVIGSAPLLAAFYSTTHTRKGDSFLPKSFRGLFLFCAVELTAFGFFWLVAWLFSRGSRDDLFLRWRGGWKTFGWGLLYAIGLQISIILLEIFLIIAVVMVLSLFGIAPHKITDFVQHNRPNTEKVFLPALSHGTLLFRALLVFCVSFVVAGPREELWRAATMAGLLRVAPKNWSQKARTCVTVVVSSVVFGLGHLYQGWTGVIGTGIIGVVLATITLRHRSLWPAAVAHGFFDAASFVALMLVSKQVK